MTDYGASDTSTTTLGANQFPINEVYVPNTGLKAIGGAHKQTDASGKDYAAALFSIQDGDDVTQGTSTDANTVNSVMGRLTKIRDLLNATLTVGGTITEANSAAISTALGAISDAAWSGSGNGSEIAILKKIVAELAATLTVSGTVTANAGTGNFQTQLVDSAGTNVAGVDASHNQLVKVNAALPAGSAVIGSTTIQATSGTALVADQSGTELRASLYGTLTTAGDTAVGVDANNRVKIAPAPANAGTIIGQVKVVDSGGTNQAGVASSTGANANGGSQLVAGAFQEIAGQGTGVVNAINTDLILSTDVSAYKWLSLHITGTYSATLSFQCSNDNVNWLSTPLTLSTFFNFANTGTSTSATNVLFTGPIYFRFFRVRATAFTSNTSLAGTLELYTSTPNLPATSMTLQGSSTGNMVDFHLISAATTNANNVKASAGQIYGYDIGNSGASDAWVKIYNKATTPTVGTDAVFRTIYVPKGGKAVYHTTLGIKLSTGIGIGITGGAADADTTAVALSQVTVELDYL